MAKKTWLWLGVATVGGYILYMWWKNQQGEATATATATTPQPASIISQPLNYPVAGTIAPTPQAPAVQTATPAAAPVTATGSPQNQPTGQTLSPSGVAVQSWMATLNQWADSSMNACDLARWNANTGNFTQAEWNGLYDLYFNDWTGGQGNTPARTTFWNTWRAKYSILTGTPC